VTEAHKCELLALGCYAAFSGWKVNPRPIDRKYNALRLRHCITVGHSVSNNTVFVRYTKFLVVLPWQREAVINKLTSTLHVYHLQSHDNLHSSVNNSIVTCLTVASSWSRRDSRFCRRHVTSSGQWMKHVIDTNGTINFHDFTDMCMLNHWLE